MRRPRRVPADAMNTVAAWLIDSVADRILERLDDHMDGRTQIAPAALRPEQAAAYLSVSESHLRRLVACGEVRAVRSTAEGGRGSVLIRVADLDRYLASADAA